MKKIVLISIFSILLLLSMPFVSGIESNLFKNEIREKYYNLLNMNILKIFVIFWLISPIFVFIINFILDDISLSDFNIIGFITLYFSSLIGSLYSFVSIFVLLILFFFIKIFKYDENPWI